MVTSLSVSETPGVIVIILGIVLLLIGFLAAIPIVWTVGIIVLVVGLILALLGSTGRQVRGRRHYF
jgi:membrane protein implicated in regulation of membrane protease activity